MTPAGSVEPNASRAVYVGGLHAYVAAHLGPDGKVWICRRFAEAREWLPVRQATPEDLEDLDRSGAAEFPILLTVTERAEHPEWPTSIPWGLIREHGDECRARHGMSPLQIAELGGLSPFELVMIFRRPGTPWVPTETAMVLVCQRLDEYFAAQKAAV